MAAVHSHIRPNTHLFLRLPSDLLKLVEIKPDTIIDIGKLGSFPSNLLLGRPYYYTYELLEKRDDEVSSRLRIVPPSELDVEATVEDPTSSESRDEPATPSAALIPNGHDLLTNNGAVITKNNRLIVDDAARQALSQQDIEELKKSSAGREVIEKILANHTGLDEKTEFSKAKYTLRKTKKYLKRFTALPMNTETLMQYISDKEPSRIMELRGEILGLVLAWSNVHFTDDAGGRNNGKRWLVIDETGGLIVAAMAEKMGILFPNFGEVDPASTKGRTTSEAGVNGTADQSRDPTASETLFDHNSKPSVHRDFALPATANTLTILHPAVQPNLSLLKHFGYDTNQPDTAHPLHTHLKPLSWLQLIHPSDDPTYREPDQVPIGELQTWKSGKRGAYWKKRRRWERCKSIVDEARSGGFDGLVVASSMEPASVLQHTIPLVRGGGHIVVYSPTAEPLVNLIDLYSRERRTAYINHLANGETPGPEDFPLDPRLLLAATLQTSRVRQWQVLPGRTHPLMTGRGGAEGYVFTASRVIPLEGGVEARGNFSTKRRKVDATAAVPSA